MMPTIVSLHDKTLTEKNWQTNKKHEVQSSENKNQIIKRQRK